MVAEGFGQLVGQDITPEELEARVNATPPPVQRFLRSIERRDAAEIRVLEGIADVDNFGLKLAGVSLMAASLEFDAAFSEFLDFMVEKSRRPNADDSSDGA